MPARKNKDHACPQCDFRASEKTTIRRHVRVVHEKLKRFKCPHCDLEKFARYHLVRHISAVHDNVKAFRCGLCDYEGATAASVRIHGRSVHERIRPFKCPICPQTASHENAIAVHVRVVHQKLKEFVCHVCARALGSNQGLQRHLIAFHTVKETFKCPHCDFSTVYRGGFRSHMRNKHGESRTVKVQPKMEEEPLPTDNEMVNEDDGWKESEEASDATDASMSESEYTLDDDDDSDTDRSSDDFASQPTFDHFQESKHNQEDTVESTAAAKEEEEVADEEEDKAEEEEESPFTLRIFASHSAQTRISRTEFDELDSALAEKAADMLEDGFEDAEDVTKTDIAYDDSGWGVIRCKGERSRQFWKDVVIGIREGKKYRAWSAMEEQLVTACVPKRFRATTFPPRRIVDILQRLNPKSEAATALQHREAVTMDDGGRELTFMVDSGFVRYLREQGQIMDFLAGTIHFRLG